MNWAKIELMVYAKDATAAKGSIFLPGDSELHELTVTNQDGAFKLLNDPFAGKVSWDIQLKSQN